MHAHHLVEKGSGKGQAGGPAEVNQKLLREADINVWLGRENLGWAPFQTAGVHGKGPQEVLMRRLEAVRGDREATTSVLRTWLQELQALKKS